MRFLDLKRRVRFEPGRGGVWPGGMGSFLFKLWHGFAGCPGGKVVIHLEFNFALEKRMSRKFFYRGKRYEEDSKFGEKVRKDFQEGGMTKLAR